MANQPIHNPKDYSEVLYSIMTTDPVRADLVNSILERLINNDAYLKDYTDAQLAGKVAQGDFNTHLAETATQTALGHVKVDGTTITATDGVISAAVEEIIKEFTVKAGESITAENVVAFVNGGLKQAQAVITGTTIAVGSPLVFESASSDYVSACLIESNKVMVVYRDNGNSGYGTACVLTISGTAITAGIPVVFESANTTNYTCACLISPNKVLVAYQDGENNNYGTACVLSISGTIITPGTPVVFESNSSLYISACAVDNDKALVTYRSAADTYGHARVLSVSGTTISAGAAISFQSTDTTFISVCALTTNKAIVAFRDVTNGNYGKSRILSVSGTSVTAGDYTMFEGASTAYISVCRLTDDKALVAYTDVSNSSYGTACVLSVSDTAITAGSPAVFESAMVNHNISVCSLDSTKAVVSYQDSANSYYGTACTLSISGTAITAGIPVVFESARTNYPSALAVDTGKVLVAYQDYGNDNYGTAEILSLPFSSEESIIGIAKESKGSGESCKVSLGPVTAGLSGLIPGTVYYTNSDGSLGTAKQYAKVGIAISSTELRQTLQIL